MIVQAYERDEVRPHGLVGQGNPEDMRATTITSDED